ncbi:MAG: hypothetical protein ACRD9S_14705 [Pyrinomonadaceae bacterium]
MKRVLELLLFVVLVATFSTSVTAQNASSVAQTVETLRLQLLDAQAKEAELQAREKQLDEDLKPENIERSLAGIGSTKPEELRESRRRQLSIERDGVRAQLKLVTTSRERLESVIRTAETRAYQQSASESSPLLNQATLGKQSWSLGWIVGIVVAVGEILGLVLLVILAMRRLRRT